MFSVLIVDDEDVLLEMIATLMEEAGFVPLEATNGREALALLDAASDTPSVVISDIMMPHIGGIELAKLLKSDPRYQHVPIILMSAAGRPPESDIADYFLYKPFDLDGLVELVDYYGRLSLR